MLDSIEKIKYRVDACIDGAQEDMHVRLTDRIELPLKGINDEPLYVTGYSQLVQKAIELDKLYETVPNHRAVKDVILLDAYSSATIEGARTTVAKVQQSVTAPKTKDDKMVINTMKALNYAYNHPITEKNIRHIWDIVVNDVCENKNLAGKLYRNDMVYIGNESRMIHKPAPVDKIVPLMSSLFQFSSNSSIPLLIRSFICHFYFVYIHPFCDGNGRTARILNNAQLYHGKYQKMRHLPLSTSINSQLNGYYSSLTDSEKLINLPDNGTKWLDLSPFISYMLDIFERCLIDAKLSKNILNNSEQKLLDRMNKQGYHAEITSVNARKILNCSNTTALRTLNSLVTKGYLLCDTSKSPHIYTLQPHI